MVNNLIVNPENYVMAFVARNNKNFEFIKKNIFDVPQSKLRSTLYNDKDVLLVDQDFYEKAIDNGIELIKSYNLKRDVYWVNKNGRLVPCGYYHIASLTTSLEHNVNNLPIITKYNREISEYLKTDTYLTYDCFNNSYGLNVKGENYDELVDSFNGFIIERDNGPFYDIELVSRYGKRLAKYFPISEMKK